MSPLIRKRLCAAWVASISSFVFSNDQSNHFSRNCSIFAGVKVAFATQRGFTWYRATMPASMWSLMWQW